MFCIIYGAEKVCEGTVFLVLTGLKSMTIKMVYQGTSTGRIPSLQKAMNRY